MDSGVVIALILFGVSLCIGLTIYLVVVTRHLNASFAKLGYLIREDAKKYFDEAADKIVDTNKQFQESYTAIVHRGTQSALQDVSVVMRQAVVDAQKDAGSIIVEARQQAQDIISGARRESELYKKRVAEASAQNLEWVIGQYIGRVYNDEQHIELIHNLLEEYLNEQKGQQ